MTSPPFSSTKQNPFTYCRFSKTCLYISWDNSFLTGLLEQRITEDFHYYDLPPPPHKSTQKNKCNTATLLSLAKQYSYEFGKTGTSLFQVKSTYYSFTVINILCCLLWSFGSISGLGLDGLNTCIIIYDTIVFRG